MLVILERRIDPGSSKYKLTNQNKIISGSNAIALRLIENIYKKIIRKKIFKAKSIKVAEAAKIIENTQRYKYSFYKRNFNAISQTRN